MAGYLWGEIILLYCLKISVAGNTSRVPAERRGLEKIPASVDQDLPDLPDKRVTGDENRPGSPGNLPQASAIKGMVPCDKDPVLPLRDPDQFVIVGMTGVQGIVPQQPQPPGKASKHNVTDKKRISRHFRKAGDGEIPDPQP